MIRLNTEDQGEKLWNALARYRPRLKSHLSISRHLYRGTVSYVLFDTLSGGRYRFSLATYRAVGRMTGKLSLAELFDSFSQSEGNSISRAQLIETVRQLGNLGALAGKLPDELQGIPTAATKNQNYFTEQLKKSPLYLRFPLFNPSQILEKFTKYLIPIYSSTFLILLMGLIGAALVQLILVWPQLTHDMLDRVFTRNNLLILWVVYPAVKSVHEFAHAFTVKHFGGEVSEMGIMSLLFVPVPYVNASDSAGFIDKWQRIAVAGAGILAELGLASIAIFVWAAAEPGTVRTIAFNIVLICAFSTVLFNGNPLVRYDGYYILTDLMEIPNLARRSSSFLWGVLLRLLSGVAPAAPTQDTPTEKRWFALYGIASLFYRWTIYGSIFYLFASRLGPVGAVIGIVAVTQILFFPVAAQIRPLLRSPLYRRKKKRIFGLAGTVLAGFICLITLVPLPYSTTAEGIVSRPETSLVKMKSPGIITTIEADPGKLVNKGQLLFTGEDEQLHHNILLLESQLRELKLKEAAAFARDPFEARLIAEKSAELAERLHSKKQQEQELSVTSPLSGKFIVQSFGELTGSFFKQGDIIGFIDTPGQTVRTMISQEDITPILEQTEEIEVRIACEPGKTFSGKIVSENPHATYHLPSKTLGTAGGGKILLNPADPDQLTSLTEMFQLDIQLDTPLEKFFPESRAWIKFNLGYEPLIYRWIRTVRQLFLSEFRG